MKYKMICTDLDGTLLNKKSEVSAENLAAIERIAKSGVEFVPVTGRVFAGIPPELLASPYVRYIICSNGACIYDKHTGEKIESDISRETLSEIRAVLSDFDYFVSVHYDGKERVDTRKYSDLAKYNIPPIFDRYYHYVGYFDDDFDNWFATTDSGIEMITGFFTTTEDRLECARRLGGLSDVYVTSSFSENIEFFSKKATKGEAVKALCEKLGIDIGDVIAVGDSGNDVPMMKEVGLGLAVANACDEAKAAADRVIVSNEEDTAKYIFDNLIGV